MAFPRMLVRASLNAARLYQPIVRAASPSMIDVAPDFIGKQVEPAFTPRTRANGGGFESGDHFKD